MITALSAGLAVGLALLHVVTRYLRFLERVPRSAWLSFAGGVATAFVFLMLLPELARHQQRIAGRGAIAEYGLYAMALAGLITFYALERAAKRGGGQRQQGEQGEKSEKETDPEHAPRSGAPMHPVALFWIHVGAFSFYNGIVGYLLAARQDRAVDTLVLFAVAVGVHFIVNDYGLHHDHGELYDHWGRWILAAAPITGWLIGYFVPVSDPVIGTFFAIIAGATLLNILREELPAERQSRLAPFLIGAVIYGAILFSL